MRILISMASLAVMAVTASATASSPSERPSHRVEEEHPPLLLLLPTSRLGQGPSNALVKTETARPRSVSASAFLAAPLSGACRVGASSVLRAAPMFAAAIVATPRRLSSLGASTG